MVMDTQHLESLVEKYIVPQVCHLEVKGQVHTRQAQKIKVAFPSVKSNAQKFCHLHNHFIYQFLECPNCKANLCYDASTSYDKCSLCGIVFMQSAQLARQVQPNQPASQRILRSLNTFSPDQIETIASQNLNLFLLKQVKDNLPQTEDNERLNLSTFAQV